jgi:cytochrome bd-type quinol oxidase subunit 1
VILKEAIYCPRCGALVSEENKRRLTQQPISWAWWLLPLVSPILLFAPWVGGVLAWAINRDKNIRLARYILIYSIVLSIIVVIVAFVYGPIIDLSNLTD